jgi:hypothetical protein
MRARLQVSTCVMTIAVAVAAVSLVGVADAGEVLVNPGFESGVLSPWTTNGTWVIETTNCHSGSSCASDVGNYYIQQTFAGVPTNTITSITFWMRQPNSEVAGVEFDYSDSTSDFNEVSPGASWSQFDVTSYLSSGKILTGLRIWGYELGGGGTPNDISVVDDVSIQTREAIPMVGWRGLLALALALGVTGAILVRRRLA